MTQNDTVNAHPTKRFFVSMLTRDIELKDAILDLLDNCIDGIERQQQGQDNDTNAKPYQGFWAKITATKDKFEIWDNCGGIPTEIALEKAFRMGRDDPERDSGLHTVGMYGIGMKRALFKMGKQSRVTSRPKDEPRAFFVEITPEWLESDHWELKLQHSETEELTENGTRVTVEQLHDNIAFQFNSDKSEFLDDLIKDIAQFYALIIDKGFSVTINGHAIGGAPLTLLTALINSQSPINPYIFKATIEGVEIRLAVGFRRKLASEKELEDEAQRPRTSDEAGWTVICNDRVVLYCDKSQITGWGRAQVPRYHTQFISIAGVLEFRSNNLLNLPLKTTKRGLDTSSTVYLSVFDYMTEGLKIFTDFTNKWKGREEETNVAFENTESKKPREILKDLDSNESVIFTNVRKLDNAQRYTPSLPRPETRNPLKRIVFNRHADEVVSLAIALFDDPQTKPSDVGERCFSLALENIIKAQSKEGGN
ncbi:ATP-binding protein [Methylovulum psychrotolerans]|uniref:ATP-binding protein n=1 Tax=Methylovulum psychrotolerans TaxID=1704499 RepID=A0A2S5CQG7_9GAMM|nr:ATP-binding protein [Methylovulum psychrotolerans]POZ52997.1 hypothetical protein AADEFJLK_00006 [Methylovulum psychrotolerans]